MEVALWHKFTQHGNLKKLLLETGERSITFVSPPPCILFLPLCSIDGVSVIQQRSHLPTRTGALEGMAKARTTSARHWRKPAGGSELAPHLSGSSVLVRLPPARTGRLHALVRFCASNAPRVLMRHSRYHGTSPRPTDSTTRT